MRLSQIPFALLLFLAAASVFAAGPTDPGERENLASKRPEVVRELQQVFEAWQQEMQEPAWPSKFEIEGHCVLIDGVEYEIHV